MQDDSPHSFSSMRIPAGTRLNEIYVIDQPIASGGMGEVYKGHTIQTGDVVAIKLMLAELAENESAMALFRKEASALHNLQHEAIVRYYVFSVEPALQRPYLAMEFVEGPSLSELLKRGPLTLDSVMLLKTRLAAGLQAAHEHGIIHRDVSPDNVIVPGNDVARAKIIDFGIARLTRSEGTVIGSGFAGKNNYVSPEQLGLFGGNVTEQSDIYSLGLLLAESLKGQPIDMGGSQFEVIEKRRTVPPLDAIDERIRPLLQQMLQPDPAHRLGSMAAVAAWSLASSESLGASAMSKARDRVSSSARSLAIPKRRLSRWWWAAGIAIVFVAAVGGTTFFLTRSTETVKESMLPPLSPGSQLASEAPPSLSPAPGPEVPSSVAGPIAPPSAPRPALQPATQPGPITGGPGTAMRPQAPTTGPGASSPNASIPAELHAGLTNPGPAVGPLSSSRPQPVDPLERLSRYVKLYDGGECFFVEPVAISNRSVRIEGYASSLAELHKLDDAFKAANGFEADIGVRQVTPEQCPAVTFLGRVRNDPGPVPQLELDQSNVREGQILTGTVRGYGSRHVELVMVSDEGVVQNLTALLKPAADGRAFKIGMQRTGDRPGAQPQLLIAVASSSPIDSLRPNAPIEAKLLFPLVLGEAARLHYGIGATAKYFKLGQ